MIYFRGEGEGSQGSPREARSFWSDIAQSRIKNRESAGRITADITDKIHGVRYWRGGDNIFLEQGSTATIWAEQIITNSTKKKLRNLIFIVKTSQYRFITINYVLFDCSDNHQTIKYAKNIKSKIFRFFYVLKHAFAMVRGKYILSTFSVYSLWSLTTECNSVTVFNGNYLKQKCVYNATMEITIKVLKKSNRKKTRQAKFQEKKRNVH